MELVTPKVFQIAETGLTAGLNEYLDHIGVPAWESVGGASDAEVLIEVMGRSCYRSFDPSLNPNLTRVREGNAPYLENIIGVKHGSVLEHASVSFMFCDVSRVFTHELVRHRQGIAISQESLRFVRLTDLKVWVPSHIREDMEAMTIFEEAIQSAEATQRALTEVLITEDMPFSEKKLITSAMRRVAPMGLATNIGWTSNFRTLRWLIELRTHESAEEEIRIVFAEVARQMIREYPNVFGDFESEIVNGFLKYTTPNSKV